MEPVPFYAMLESLSGKDLADLMEDGCRYSLPVSLQRAGRLFDALFLYKPGQGSQTDPTGWLLLDSFTGKLAVLADCSVMDFAASDLIPPDQPKKSHARGLTAKKEADMRLKLGECYDAMRGFAFTEMLTREQAAVVTTYKDLFLKLGLPEHYPFYYALSPAFFHWLRLPLPVHRANVNPEDGAVLEDASKLLILENLQRLVVRFEQKIQVDAHKQQLFDEMHSELQEYKNGLLDRLTLLLERDIIKVIDDVERSVELFSGKEPSPENFGKLYAIFAGIATDLEDLLYRHGVEPYRMDGDSVNVMRQKVLTTVATADASLDKKIAKRISRGWEKEDKIIRPEQISAYLYREEQDT